MGWGTGRTLARLSALLLAAGCSSADVDDDKPRDGGTPRDGGMVVVVGRDGGTRDAGEQTQPDGGTDDGGTVRDGGDDRDGGELPRDGGPTPADASTDGGAPFDAGSPDDAGPGIDGGFRDGGPRDGGPQPACPDGTEGCACTFGLTCNDPALTCFAASPNGTPPAQQMHICLRLCAADTDCTPSTVNNNICRPVRADQNACVSAEVGEGLPIDISRLTAPAMTGCQLDLFAFPPFASSGLSALADDQASCARACDPTAASGQPNSCTAAFPYCNPDVLASITTPGICTLRRAQSGDVCSRSSAVGLCDTAQNMGVSPSPICLGVPFDMLNPGDPSPIPEVGMCVIQCSLANPNCSLVDDPTLGPAVCRQVRATNTTTGICSNDCTTYPSRCGDVGVFNLGTTCTGDVNFEPTLPFSFCRNVMGPTIPEYNFAGTPPPSQRCRALPGSEVRCEANVVCLDDMAGGLCIRTCDAAGTTPAMTGCAPSTVGNMSCDDTLVGTPTDGRGACRP